MKTMREGNKGLTVKLNLWALDEDVYPDFDSEKARLWIKGQITHADPPHESKKFNDAGELLTILGKWNAEKFRELKRQKRGV